MYNFCRYHVSLKKVCEKDEIIEEMVSKWQNQVVQVEERAKRDGVAGKRVRINQRVRNHIQVKVQRTLQKVKKRKEPIDWANKVLENYRLIFLKKGE